MGGRERGLPDGNKPFLSSLALLAEDVGKCLGGQEVQCNLLCKHLRGDNATHYLLKDTR